MIEAANSSFTIAELVCREYDCPDVETVVGVMRPGAPIATIRIHKAIADIVLEDLTHSTCND